MLIKNGINQGLCHSIFFSDLLDIFSRQVIYILTNFSAFIIVTFSSHSLLFLSTHSLIGWIPQESLICRLLILSIFVKQTIFLSTFISFVSNICLVFDVSALVSNAYVIIGRIVALYILEIGINVSNLVDLAQDRDYLRAVLNVALNFWVPLALCEQAPAGFFDLLASYSIYFRFSNYFS